MVGVTMVLVLLIGTPVGIALHNTSDFGLFPDPRIFRVLNTIVNVGRSLPFLILMTAIIPSRVSSWAPRSASPRRSCP